MTETLEKGEKEGQRVHKNCSVYLVLTTQENERSLGMETDTEESRPSLPPYRVPLCAEGGCGGPLEVRLVDQGEVSGGCTQS